MDAEINSGQLGNVGSLFLVLEIEMEVYVDESLERLDEIKNSLLNMMRDSSTQEILKAISSYTNEIGRHSYKVLEIIKRIDIEARLTSSIAK